MKEREGRTSIGLSSMYVSVTACKQNRGKSVDAGKILSNRPIGYVGPIEIKNTMAMHCGADW